MPFRAAFARYRLLAFRALRRAVAWAEPHDLASVTGRFDHGDVVWLAFRDAGAALAGNGRFDEADGMLSRGLATFPDDRELLVAYAMSAHAAGRYAAAVDRWEAALRAGSDDPMCYPGLAANLRTLGEHERAQTAIDEALRRAPDDLTAITEAARLASARERQEDALVLWRKAVATPHPHPDWLQGHAQTLLRLNEFDAVEEALTAARAAHPDHAGLCGVEGALKSAREDWPAAIAHWTAYRRRYPDDPIGWEQLGIAVQQSQMNERIGETADHVGPEEFRAILPAAIEVVDDETCRQLMLRFESIGDNCELGLVQRRFAAEPLGLLRWNTVSYEKLVAALAQGFEGMGEAANTEMAVAPNGEYFMRDRRWSLGMHTFLFAGQTDSDALYTKMCRRITYLRDKLVADLKMAEKIFVYRSPGIDEERLDALHRLLSGFGPVTLMAVQPVVAASTFQGAAGDILKVGDRRYLGFLDHAGVDSQGNWNIAFDDWTSVCRKIVAA